MRHRKRPELSGLFLCGLDLPVPFQIHLPSAFIVVSETVLHVEEEVSVFSHPVREAEPTSYHVPSFSYVVDSVPIQSTARMLWASRNLEEGENAAMIANLGFHFISPPI